MSIKVNPHGIWGLCAIIAMLIFAVMLHWRIPWLYFALAMLLYSTAVITLNLILEGTVSPSDRADLLRFLFGCHLAFVFLAVGMLLPVESFFAWAAIFVAAIAAGIAIPYMVVTKR